MERWLKRFSRFPRQIANPMRYLVESMEQFLNFINSNIDKTDLFTTVYGGFKINNKTLDFNSAFIDKVFLDLDSEKSWEETKTLHEHLMKEDLLHKIHFSGRGLHTFVICQIDELKNKKDAIYSYQDYITKKLNLTPDRQCFGDIARICRIPNTFNFKRKRFCIPLTEGDLKLSYDEVKEKAKRQQFKAQVFGSKLLDLKKFDKPISRYNIQMEFPEFESVDTGTDIEFPPCLKMIIAKHKKAYVDGAGNWEDRRLIICWIRDNGRSLNDCVNILKSLLSPEEFRHCMSEENHQPRYLYRRRDLFFPNCSTIENKNMCPCVGKECEWKNSLYIR